MTDGVRFTEVYTDPKSDIFAYVGAMGWAPELVKPGNPTGILGMLGTLKGRHDEPRGTVPLPLAGHRRGRLAGVARRAAVDHAVAAGAAVEPARHGARRQRDARPARHRGHLCGHEHEPARPRPHRPDAAAARTRGEQQIIPARVVDDLIRGGDPRAFEARASPPRGLVVPRPMVDQPAEAALVRGDGRLRAAPVRLPRPPDGGGDVRQPPAADRGTLCRSSHARAFAAMIDLLGSTPAR